MARLKQRRIPRRSRSRSSLIERLENRTLFAFGITSTTGSLASYVIDNGADLKFSVLRPGATVTSTIHLGDVTSIKYKNQELLASYATTSRYSHYEQGLGSIATVTTTTGGTTGSRWILVTCDDSAETSGGVIQYYAVRENDNNLYMASLPTDVTNGPGEGRFIAYLNRSVFTTPEAPSDNAGTTGAIEGSDVFGHADGTTTSKFYNMGRRMIDNTYHGLTGTAGTTSVGAWMFMGNREHSAGGPFFKDIDYQSDAAVEIYNCLFTGHTQTEAFRQGLQGPYAFQFTSGVAPTTPDYSWMSALNLQGWIPVAQRGAISGTASGMVAGHQTVVGLSNGTAQYWTYANASTGSYSITGVQPGTYTETLYDNELEVGHKTVTITAGATSSANIVNTFYIPASPIFRIGTWDGTPAGFLNADKISIMHPTDVRMSSWTATPNFVIGTNTDAQWPLAQAIDVNNAQRITFTLTAAQVQSLSFRVGITWGFSGARPRITVNSGQTYAWTSTIPTASSDLNSRGITRGTWRGDNQIYTYSIPSSAVRAGVNTIDLPLVSGSTGAAWLSPNVAYDAIELDTSSTASAPAIASVTVTPVNSSIGINGTRTFTAVARDANGNVIAANIDWSAARGTIDANGNYTAPATLGSDTITATATTTRIAGYNSTSSSTSTISKTISGSGSTTINVLDAVPSVATPASASPNPAFSLSTALSVLGSDDGGESNLTYTWSAINTPPGSVNFSINGTNAAKNTTVTFGAYGSYDLLVTITDQQNNSVTSQVTVVCREHVARYKADETGGTTLADSSGGNNTANLS
ncbi:MAG TPA: rhamnogalacturonan lyase B N-terminal domain-containing protein, partial [Tepidisphaeraceae bacterium]|nr:rhamnogalacturonan lyase B N-terminal domain-containing protein [Tepidisphaeraceae bacterium]